MDEMESEGDFSSMPKMNNSNIEGKMVKECEIETINSGHNDSKRFEIASSELMEVNDEQLNSSFAGKSKEEFMSDFYMEIGGEEKEDMKVEMNNVEVGNDEIEITSFETMKMNGEESILTFDAKGFSGNEVIYEEYAKEEVKNEEQVEAISHEGEREFNGVVTDEQEKAHIPRELNTLENVDEEVVYEKDAKEKVTNEEQIEAIAKKKTVKSRKRLKKGLKNNIASRDVHDVIVNDMNPQEPLTKNLQTMEDLNSNGMHNEEQVEEISKKLRNRKEQGPKKMFLKGKKKVTIKDAYDQEPLNNNLLEELNSKENGDGGVMSEERAKEGIKDGKQVEEIPKKKINRLRKDLKKSSNNLKGVNEVTVKGTNNREPLDKKATKKAKIAGMIFMCSAKTKKDCYRYNILGLPSHKRDDVLKIRKGMKLFLFDFDLKLLYGIYEAAGPGGYNIEPKVFKSAFPSQVRFNVYKDCLPLPEEKFRNAIKDNYYQKNKFHSQLTPKQVNNLCKLFRVATKGSKSKDPHRDPEAQKHKPLPSKLHKPTRDDRSAKFTDRDWSRKQHFEAESHRSIHHDRAAARGSKSKGLHKDSEAHTHKPLPSKLHKPTRDDRSAKFTDRDRGRKRRFETETHRAIHQDRTRKRHRNALERDIYTSPVLPPSHGPLPPPSALELTPRSYAYEGTLDMNVYRRNPLVEHHERQFRDLELRQGVGIDRSRDSFNGHHDRQFRDLELRQGARIDQSRYSFNEHHDRQFRYLELRDGSHIDQLRDSFNEHQDRRYLGSELRPREGIEHRDPYAMYRDRPLYLDRSNSPAQPSEYHAGSRTSLYAPSQPGTALYDRYIGARSWY